MTKQEVYDYVKAQGISFEITEHPAVYNMEELISVELPYPERIAKNLFVRDDKKQNYYLITVLGESRVDLKAFRRENGLKPLSFATAEELFEYLGLTPGSVTPLGLLNDVGHRVRFFLDESFGDGVVGVHPCDNTATVWLKAPDLLKLLQATGADVSVVHLPTAE